MSDARVFLTDTVAVFQGQVVAASTSTGASAIHRADGFSRLVANFLWTDSYAMANSNNYQVNWYMDAAGTQKVAMSTFGAGSSDAQSDSLEVVAPYFSLQATNLDTTTAHPLDAWAYLKPRD